MRKYTANMTNITVTMLVTILVIIVTCSAGGGMVGGLIENIASTNIA